MSLFFFSSRRRHTIFSRDWSSDVCSSDLDVGGERPLAQLRGFLGDPLAQLLERARPSGAVRIQLGDEVLHDVDRVLKRLNLVDPPLLLPGELVGGHGFPQSGASSASVSTRPSSGSAGVSPSSRASVGAMSTVLTRSRYTPRRTPRPARM